MQKREKKFKGFVVSHTHWDRAWYWPFQKYRIRLVQTIDQLIDILLNTPDYKSFTLDGQSVVLEDYLEVKPEKAEILKQLIKEKKIFVGPWYVLPDEFLVSGESIVRNLLLGTQIAGKFGNVMNEGYVPDPFGHIAQLPQILKGFNIDSFIFARGYKMDLNKVGSEFLWEAPDGSKVITIYLKNSYCHFAWLGFEKIWGDFRKIDPDKETALKRLKDEFKELSKYANSDKILFTNGCDHLPPQKEIPELLEYINSKQDDIEMIHSNFPEFISEIKKSDIKMKTFSGELIGNRYQYILLGVYSTRMYLKQMNYFAQNLFEKFVEPIAAFSKILGGYNYQPSIWSGWKLILKNHPHDDICGAGADEIHRDMVNRYEQSFQVGEYIAKHSFIELAQHINTSSIPDSKPVIIYNPNNWQETDYLELDLLFETDDETAENFKIIDSGRKEINYTIISDEIYNTVEILREATYRKIRILLEVENIPGIGYKTIYVVKGKKQPNVKYWKTAKNQIENEFFIVTANSNGTINLFDKINKNTLKNLNLFEDTEDIGDEYTYSYAKESKTFTTEKSRSSIKVKDNGFCAEMTISVNLRIPDSIHPSRLKRSAKMVTLPITTVVRLSKGVRRVDVKTTINNIAKDHRVRAIFPSGILTDKCTSDGHFAFIERDVTPIKKPTFKEKFEYYGTRNQQRFISVSNEKSGLTIANKGLPEYEVLRQKGKSIIALTLFRSVGAISHPDLITRPGNAGPMLSTPEAQCLGVSSFEYSIIPHSKNVIKSKAFKDAIQYNSGLFYYNAKPSMNGQLEDTMELIFINSDDILISTIKKSEIGDNLIIRLYNPTAENFSSDIKVFKNFRKAYIVNLKEEILSEIAVQDENTVKVEFPPYKILSLLLEF